MDKSVPEQQTSTPQEIKLYWIVLLALGRILKWLAGLMQLTEAEREEAGIHVERVSRR
jgi:hypothetical protein